MDRDQEIRSVSLELEHVNSLLVERLRTEKAALETQLAKLAADQKAAAALLEPSVAALLQFERIDPRVRAKAASMLGTHAGTLEILIKAADPSNTARPATLGGPAADPRTGAVKQAAANPLRRFVGERHVGEDQAELDFRRSFLGG